MNIKEFIVESTKVIFVCILLLISSLNYIRIKGSECSLCAGLRGFSVSIDSFKVKNGSFLILKEGTYSFGDMVGLRDSSDNWSIGLVDSISTDNFVLDTTSGAIVMRNDLIEGRVIFVIPYLGYLMTVIDSQLGVFLLVILPICVILVMEIESIINYVNKKWGVGSYDIKRPS